GSANGVAITANKHQFIRAGLCWENDVAKLVRQHNNANIICLPARFIALPLAFEMIQTFMNIPFEGGRHERRVSKTTCVEFFKRISTLMNIHYVANMEEPEMHTIHFKTNVPPKQLLPILKSPNISYCTCARCNYVNAVSHNFCTNCGYPVKEKENAALYHIRFKQRKELLQKGEKAVQAARVVLYILAAILLAGIGFFFSELDNCSILGLAS